jgi:hypothetical protein
MGVRAKDHTGRRFGRLVVVSRAGNDRFGRVVWHCECDCGGFAKVPAAHLVKGDTKSCGCLYRDTRLSTLQAAGKLWWTP